MNNYLRSKIIDWLLGKNMCEISYEEIENIIEIDNVGISSDGTKYNKAMVIEYLTSRGYPLTQEYLDLASKMFPAQGEKITKKEKKTVVHTDLEDLTDDEIKTYIELKILEELHSLQTDTFTLEYAVETVIDSFSGGTNKNELQNLLNKYSKDGWRLKNIYTNELGHNSSSISIGGSTAGTNATIDQIVLIFERPKRN